MQKRKILYLITKGNGGGAQKYVHDLASSLPRAAYDAVVACGEGEALPAALATAKIRCVRLSSLGRDINCADARAFHDIFLLLKTERPDILHLNSSKAAFLGALAARLAEFSIFNFSAKGGSASDGQFSTKIVFTVHGWPFNEPRPTLQRLGIYTLSWLTALLSHAVITICDADFASGRRMLFIARKIHVIHNGIHPSPPPIKRKDAILHIASIAELTKNKGLAYALAGVAAIARDTTLPPFQYTIFGEGEERGTLEKIILERQLGGIVRLAGFTKNASVHLANADIYLSPSLKEGLPYALLEAGAAGVAVVATHIGGVPDIVEDMKTGVLIRPKREREIAEALRFLLTDHKKRAELGTALRAKIISDFSFKKMLTHTQNLYQSLIC